MRLRRRGGGGSGVSQPAGQNMKKPWSITPMRLWISNRIQVDAGRLIITNPRLKGRQDRRATIIARRPSIGNRAQATHPD